MNGYTFNNATCNCEPNVMCTKDLCWDGSARNPMNDCACPQCLIKPRCIPGFAFNNVTCNCDPIKICTGDLCWDGSARNPLADCSCPTCVNV